MILEHYSTTQDGRDTMESGDDSISPDFLENVAVPGCDPREMSYKEVADKLYSAAKACDNYVPSPDVFFWAGVACQKLADTKVQGQ